MCTYLGRVKQIRGEGGGEDRRDVREDEHTKENPDRGEEPAEGRDDCFLAVDDAIEELVTTSSPLSYI